MISRKKWLAAAAGIAATLTFGTPAAMAGTVVAVTGPSAGDYPVGTQIGDTQRITLRQGDRLTVLDNGGTRVFSGPGTFILARQGRTSTNSAFGALTRQRQARTARTGAVRGTKTEGPTRPNLWYVDVATGGKMCVSDPTSVRLWRSNTEAEASYSVSAVANPESSVDIAFGEGEMLTGWDSRIALTEGLIYSVGEAGGDSKVQIDFVFLDEVPDNPEGLASALIENGCMAQLAILSNAMAEN